VVITIIINTAIRLSLVYKEVSTSNSHVVILATLITGIFACKSSFVLIVLGSFCPHSLVGCCVLKTFLCRRLTFLSVFSSEARLVLKEMDLQIVFDLPWRRNYGICSYKKSL
jgi:hypothetical protein